MLPSRIPVALIATDPAEIAAFSDILTPGATTNLVPATNDEPALIYILCPSGNLADAPSDMPTLILGHPDAQNTDYHRLLATPARLADILLEVEKLLNHIMSQNTTRQYGNWQLDLTQNELQKADAPPIALTYTECRLLAILFDGAGEQIGRDTLLQRVWGYRPGLDTHTLETHIYRLRQKIEQDPTNPVFLLTTEAGYKLAEI